MSDTTTTPAGATGEGTANSPWFDTVEVQLTGEDGNAYAILGAVAKGMRRAGVDSKEVTRFNEEAMSGDYDNLLQTTMCWVNVS